jgi:hypothetical protein
MAMSPWPVNTLFTYKHADLFMPNRCKYVSELLKQLYVFLINETKDGIGFRRCI